MSRREFSKAIRVAVIKRATRHGVGDTAQSLVYCESCALPAKKFQIDHVRADGLLGEPTIENAELICEVCYGIKNSQDTKAIAKAKRREALALSAKPPSPRPMQSRGWAKAEKPKREARPVANGISAIARQFRSTT